MTPLLAFLALVAQPSAHVLTEGLSLTGAANYGRAPFPTDAILAQFASGVWTEPREGAEFELPDGRKLEWKRVTAGEDGRIGAAGAFLHWRVDSPATSVKVLEASGHAMAFVGGEPRAGDGYGYGYVRLPVALQAGSNSILFHVGRGPMRARLVDPPAPQFVSVDEATLPDYLGDEPQGPGAALIVNASSASASDMRFVVTVGKEQVFTEGTISVPPLTVYKARFELPRVALAAGEHPMTITLQRRQGRAWFDVHSAESRVRFRLPHETHKHTFVSAIDGSVQYWVLRPALGPPGLRKSLVLSLHGASVEATSQADTYGPKLWAHFACPTNRRPYGFDWEDWGRLDALEVLEQARELLDFESDRVYLTGHSMGGHGAWHLAVTHPDLFAAVGPSAAWISFTSYTGAPKLADDAGVEGTLSRAVAGSDTLLRAGNLGQLGVYILHGDADDNVPVTEARAMRKALEDLGIPFDYHEQPGAGHWWESSDEPGAECMDWPPMFDFFARRALPGATAVRRVRFDTVDPFASASCHWAAVLQQVSPMKPSRIDIHADPNARRFVGTTENVAVLRLDATPLVAGESPVRIEIDGQSLSVPSRQSIHLRRTGDTWADAPAPPATHKGPNLGGPFKAAFRNGVTFVYGTRGNERENARSYAKARYDAETFWYRGNAAIRVLSDREWLALRDDSRNAILYGNADTNAAWARALDGCPIEVRRGRVRVGERTLTGEDLACLFLYPRRDAPTALIGAVASTGEAGEWATTRLPYVLSGVQYPDWIVFGADSLRLGVGGVRGAGFFANDWSLSPSDSAWSVEASR